MKTHFYLFIFLFIFSSVFAQKVDDPVAVDDFATLEQYGSVSINVIENDYDPNGEAIYIYELEEEDGFEISFQDSIVTINALSYDDREQISIRYRIKNESGEDDRADIILNLIENPDVPVPVRDIFDLQCQTEQVMNLIDNDEYSGTEPIIIAEITQKFNVEVEILEDQQSVKVKAGLQNGAFNFSYRIKEESGNEYISKEINNFVYIHQNSDAPLGLKDSLQMEMGQTMLIDVLANDISDESLMIDTIGLPDYVEIVNNQLQITCPVGVYSNLDFEYEAYEMESNLRTQATSVRILIDEILNIPIAVDDIFEMEYSDTIILRPLENDLNFNAEALVLNDGDTLITLVYPYPNIISFNRWQQWEYSCRNVNSDLQSQLATIQYRILPPDSFAMEDVYFDYQIGDQMVFNPRAYLTIADSIEYGVSLDIDGPGEVSLEGEQLVYHCDIEKLPYYYFDAQDHITDMLTCRYSYSIDGFPVFLEQHFYFKYDLAANYSFLDINHFNIPVSPLGMHYNSNYQPTNSMINEDDVFQQIKPWMANDYHDEGRLQMSADRWLNNGFDFFSGPIADEYSAEYEDKYFRTWKITKEQIDFHIQNYSQGTYEIPEAILNWPAGNISYHGELYEQADFVDINENGEYEPEEGDYPKISGDMAILYIINDGRFVAEKDLIWNLDSLHVDVFALVYAFDRPESDLFQNTFFVKYKVVNKSSMSYPEFRFSQWVQYSYMFGQQNIACDTVLNIFYAYPRNDMGNFVSAVTLLNKKMDKFLTFGDVDNNPYYHYAHMVGRNDGDFQSYHEPSWAEYAPLDYAFPSAIDDPNGWSAYTHFDGVNVYGGWDGVASFESDELTAGAIEYYELAFSVYTQENPDYFELVEESLGQVSDLIECYQNDSIPGGGSFTGLNENLNIQESAIQIYPNPARSTLYIQTNLSNLKTYRIYSLHGQLLEESKFEAQVSIQHLPPGFYFLSLIGEKGKMELTRKFVKQ